jgi:hypothetical protein
MKAAGKIVRTVAWILMAGGCCLFLLGASLTVGAVRHNMQWKLVEASVVRVRVGTSQTKDCRLQYSVNGAQLRHRFFRSDSVAEGAIGKQKNYYSQGNADEISLSRDCGLGVFAGEVVAFTGLVFAIPSIVSLFFRHPRSPTR